jgi:HK97 family phage prohead protease
MAKTASGIVLPAFPERYITTKSGKTKRVEYKVISGELKAINDDQGIVEGYLNVIGNIDYGKDRTKAKAFSRTIDLSYKRKKANNYEFLWPYLWNHDTDLLPPGGIFDADEDQKGLFIKARLNLELQLGREMYSSYKFGSLHKQSMGYIAHQSDWVREGDENVRDLIEVEILEGSGVIFPMNDLADVTNVKSVFNGLGGTIVEEKDAKVNQAIMQKKTVLENYADETCKDLLEDWRDVFLCIITKSVLEAFKIGDSPEQDISQALDGWKELVLSKFVAQAIECNLAQYISDSGYSYSPADYTMQYGSDSKPNYGYMSNNRRHASKAGKPISSANQQRIDDHVSNLKSLADNAMSSMKEHTKAIRTAADDFATTMQGAEVPYAGDDPGKPDDGRQEGKSNPATPLQQEARSTSEHSHESTADEDERELEQAFAFIKDLMAA